MFQLQDWQPCWYLQSLSPKLSLYVPTEQGLKAKNKNFTFSYYV